MSEFFSIHKREDFLPFLFPEKFVKKITKNLDEVVPKIVKDFTKNLDERLLVNFFTKNLDEFRLKNIFLDFFRNLVYTLGILKKE